jgi:hypothetical protein
LSACGSSGSVKASASVVKSACEKVNAALSDGPDPDADPVGYAEAQVHPLSSIRTSDAALQVDITSLAKAYQSFFTSNGATSTSGAVTTSLKTVNALCKGYSS